MNKTKYGSQVGSESFTSIANTKMIIEKDLISVDTPDGFVSLSLSYHLGSKNPIPKEIGDKYVYNKRGEVKNLKTGRLLKTSHNEFKASFGGKTYELYMPKNTILASRVEAVGEMDDIIFRNIKEACEHFKCNYRTIKQCLDKSGVKAFKGYYFEYAWPEPYVI